MSVQAHSVQTREKIGAAHRGRTLQPDQRAKIAESIRRHWEERRRRQPLTMAEFLAAEDAYEASLASR